MLTREQQGVLLHAAARLSHMDGHVRDTGVTAAERVMQMFGGKRNTPRKVSYLYCDAVDACFFYQNDEACCTFTARWFAGARDLTMLGTVGALVETMLGNMQRLAEEALMGGRDSG